MLYNTGTFACKYKAWHKGPSCQVEIVQGQVFRGLVPGQAMNTGFSISTSTRDSTVFDLIGARGAYINLFSTTRAVSKWPRWRWEVKHNQPNIFLKLFLIGWPGHIIVNNDKGCIIAIELNKSYCPLPGACAILTRATLKKVYKIL